MKHSPFFETPPASPRQQTLGQAGRWFRSKGRILVLPDNEAQPDYETAEIPSRSARLLTDGRILSYTTKDVTL